MPKHLSNTAATVALEVPTMRCRISVAKLGFLIQDLSKGSHDLCDRVVLSLCDDFDSLCLVHECRELEEVHSTGFTDAIVNKKVCSLNEIKRWCIVRLGRGHLRSAERKLPQICCCG